MNLQLPSPTPFLPAKPGCPPPVFFAVLRNCAPGRPGVQATFGSRFQRLLGRGSFFSATAMIGGFLLGNIAAGPTARGAIINVSSISALQSAINSAASDDEIVLANGTYLNNTISIGKSRITVRAATPGGVYLNGTNAITISGNYVTFSGFQFTSGSITGNVIQVNGSNNLLTQLNFNGYSAQKYIVINNGTQYNVVSYCNLENKPTTAPMGNLLHVSADATVVGYHKIRYCSFQNMPGLGGDNGNEPIRLSNGVESTYISRTIVEYCYWNNTGLGDSESISVKCRENTIRYCTFTNQQNAMLVFRNGNDNVAYGNFFIGAGGIRMKEANNIYCYDNYFENSGVGGTMDAITFDYVSPNLNNINLVHNTFVNCGLIDLGGTGPANVTIANNIFKKTSGSIFSNANAGTTWAGNIYNGTLGISIPSGMTNINPQLVLNSDGYYGLSSSSPAINAASASYPAIFDISGVDDDPSLLLDISGQARPATVTLKDVGCDEFTTGSITNRPLILADVGPSYLGGPGTPMPPAITTQPVSQTVTAGADVTFTVVATGSPAPAYQWKKDTVNLSGATNASLALTAVTAASAGSYTVVATNAAGTVTSDAAVLTLTQSITFAPLADRLFTPTPFTLTATASSGLTVVFAVLSGPATVTGDSITLTGIGTVTVRASQPGNASYVAAPDSDRSFAVTPSFASWQRSNFTTAELADPNVSGPDAIAGFDGISNLLRYALGLSRTQPTVPALPQLVIASNEMVFTYQRPAATTDVIYAVEASTDLAGWSGTGVTHEQVSTANGTEQWRARFALVASGKVFMRLRTTLLPNP